MQASKLNLCINNLGEGMCIDVKYLTQMWITFLNSTLNIVVTVTHCLKLCNAISTVYISHILSTKFKLIVWIL